MKKLFSLILACLMLAAVSCPAFAGFEGAYAAGPENEAAAARGYQLYMLCDEYLCVEPGGARMYPYKIAYKDNTVNDSPVDGEVIVYVGSVAWRHIEISNGLWSGEKGWVPNASVTSYYVRSTETVAE